MGEVDNQPIESATAEQFIDVVYQGTTYSISNMAGCTIAYLKNFLNQNGVPVADNEPAEVFSMNPNRRNPAAIINEGSGMRMEPMVAGATSGVKILQGLIIDVTDDYELSDGDLSVKFGKSD